MTDDINIKLRNFRNGLRRRHEPGDEILRLFEDTFAREFAAAAGEDVVAAAETSDPKGGGNVSGNDNAGWRAWFEHPSGETYSVLLKGAICPGSAATDAQAEAAARGTRCIRLEVWNRDDYLSESRGDAAEYIEAVLERPAMFVGGSVQSFEVVLLNVLNLWSVIFAIDADPKTDLFTIYHERFGASPGACGPGPKLVERYGDDPTHEEIRSFYRAVAEAVVPELRASSEVPEREGPPAGTP